MSVVLAILLAGAPQPAEPKFTDGHEMAVACRDALTSARSGDPLSNGDFMGCSAYVLGVIDATAIANTCTNVEIRPDRIIEEAASLPYADKPNYARLIVAATEKLFPCQR